MKYADLRDFVRQLEAQGDLRRIRVPVSPVLEMTEICDRTLRAGGPALLIEAPTGNTMPVLANLFGTPRRVARGMGAENVAALREVGELLASLKEPEPPTGLKDALGKVAMLKSALWDMAPRTVRAAPCQEIVREGGEDDFASLPIQTCWPGDAGPLITWGLVVTRGPHRKRQNLGIYRQQVIGPNRLIMRWLAHRGGALDFRDHRLARPGQPFPIAVALGADPATILGAVTARAVERQGCPNAQLDGSRVESEFGLDAVARELLDRAMQKLADFGPRISPAVAFNSNHRRPGGRGSCNGGASLGSDHLATTRSPTGKHFALNLAISRGD